MRDGVSARVIGHMYGRDVSWVRGRKSLPETVQHPEMPFPCLQGPAGLDGLDGKDGKPGLRVRWRCVLGCLWAGALSFS